MKHNVVYIKLNNKIYFHCSKVMWKRNLTAMAMETSVLKRVAVCVSLAGRDQTAPTLNVQITATTRAAVHMGDACALKDFLQKTVLRRSALWTVVHMVSVWAAFASAPMVSLVKTALRQSVQTTVLAEAAVRIESVFVIIPGQDLIALNSYVLKTASTVGAVKMAPAFVMRGTREWTVGSALVSTAATVMVSV